MILAGDIGGTNARLAFFEVDGERLVPVVGATYPSRRHGSLDEIALRFVDEHGLKPKFACFGVAGPCQHGVCSITNLPWTVDAHRLAIGLRMKEVLVINDLAATAYSIGVLEPDQLAVLHDGAVDAEGNLGVIAAGTGLGESGLYWDGRAHHPFACEGGHEDFAPHDEREIALLQYLIAEFGHVSWERVLSGPGLYNIFRFLQSANPDRVDEEVNRQIELADPRTAAPIVSAAALEERCPVCVEALDMFVSFYGAEAGNLALKVMATGGMFLGGGIAPKILPRLQTGGFLQAFVAKGRVRPILEAIPVRVILTGKAPLLGAARCATLHR